LPSGQEGATIVAVFRRAARGLVWVASVGLLAVTWGYVAKQLIGAKPVTPPAENRPTAIVWDNRVFPDRNAFARWLRSRGSSLERWEATHPAAVAEIEGRAPSTFRPPSATASSTRPATTTAPAGHGAAPTALSGKPAHAAAPAPRGSGVWASILEAILLLAALAAMVAGGVPVHVLQFRGITPPSASARLYLFVAGFATGAGVLAAIVLG
jgi:hypothetical protein